MALLNKLFGSPESLAKEMSVDDEKVQKIWNDYLATVPEKKRLISAPAQDHATLRKLLELELVDVNEDESREAELRSDLHSLSHDERIRRIHRLEQCLRYFETRYEYTHGLLRHLHGILKEEAHLLDTLPADLSEKFILQLELEEEIIGKIAKMKTFPAMFSALVTGEHIIRTMNDKEKRLLKRMDVEFESGITYDLTIAVFKGVEDKVHEAIAKEILDGYHPDVDFEFVNRPEFVELVKEKVKQMRKREFTPEMLTVFVRLFRTWYNNRE